MTVQQTTGDLLTTVTVRTCPNPVFVIGSPRSGTSVLPWSLAHHWDFWTSGETEFIHAFFDQGSAVYKALCEKKRTFIPTNGVGHEEFFSSLGLGVNALISSRSNGQRWIDQSPGYTTMAWVLADMFPGAQFIHVLRDGRSVVNSMAYAGIGNGQSERHYRGPKASGSHLVRVRRRAPGLSRVDQPPSAEDADQQVDDENRDRDDD